MNGAERSDDSQQRRIAMLAAQAFALGLTMAWILIPASAIFLETYGSGLLPATYIGAAIAGVVSSKALTAAFQRRPLAWVAARMLGGVAIALLASWILLWRANADWVSFPLLVLVPIVVPVGFMVVVGQAGILLDVRVLKATYARVVAGFALGFVVGGVAAPVLLAALGRTEHLLAAAAGASAVFLGLVNATRRSFPTELSTVEHGEAGTGRPTARTLMRDRYVMLIVAFQMLSAVESQWLDFLVFDRAARRYEDSRELARFISRFSAIAYGADILFLLVVAGVLLRKFGLRYGLTANAAGVLALIAAVIVAASVQGSGATIVFLLIVAARVTDLVLSDGTSRTSLSAAYQAVPTSLRLSAQAATEGLAVPVAIGISGVVLLVVRAAGRINGSTLAMLTGLVVAAWAVVAVLLYREYRVNILAGLRQRTLYPAALNIDVANNLLAIDRLIDSDDERDVRLGLDILTTAEDPALPARLRRLVVHERADTRVDALERLARFDLQIAAAAARNALNDSSEYVRAACIRVLEAAAEPSDIVAIAARSTDASSEVKVAVAAALSRIGNADDRAGIAIEIARLGRSDVARDRLTAADMLRECALGRMDRHALRALLADPDLGVVNAALTAICWPHDAGLVVEVADRLHNPRTSGAAVDALVRGGDATLVLVERDLRGDAFGRREQELLARVCRGIGSSAAIDLLRRHVEHRDREVGLAVMTALAELSPQHSVARIAASGSEHSEPDATQSAVLRADLEHAAHVLRAVLAFGDIPSATPMCAALRDELDILRNRILANLSMRYGNETLNRITFQFAQRDARFHALALEWLDVTLSGTDRVVVAIIEPGLSDGERMSALARAFPLDPLSQHDVLLDLIEDRDERWRRPWITACALYAAASIPDIDLDGISPAGDKSATTSHSDDEAGVVHETLDWIRQRRLEPRHHGRTPG